jgi:hypothetical protein
MNRIKTYLSGIGRTSRAVLVALAVIFAGAGIAEAATVISTNILTGGTLGVSGLSSLGQASTTMLSANSAYFGNGATATSTFDTAGDLSVGGSLTVTGATTLSSTLSVSSLALLGQASSTMFSANKAYFGGIGSGATTTISSAGNLAVGGTLTVSAVGTGSAVSNIVDGYCVITTGFTATNATSTPTNTNCVPSGGASVIATGDRVIVMATSSLPTWVIIQSASSTALGINMNLLNTSTSTTVVSATYAFNFWAFQ